MQDVAHFRDRKSPESGDRSVLAQRLWTPSFKPQDLELPRG